jgi:hypothetical protein
MFQLGWTRGENTCALRWPPVGEQNSLAEATYRDGALLFNFERRGRLPLISFENESGWTETHELRVILMSNYFILPTL